MGDRESDDDRSYEETGDIAHHYGLRSNKVRPVRALQNSDTARHLANNIANCQR